MSAPATAAPPAAPPAVIDWLLVGLLSLLMGVIGVFGVFYLPMYVGAVALPVSVLPVALAVAVIPRVAYRLTHRMPAALAPVLVWLVVSVALYGVTNSLYLSVPVAWRGWQFVVLLGLGALTAAASIGLLWGAHLRTEFDARRIAAPGRPAAR